MWKKVLTGILSVAFVFAGLIAVQKLVVPKYMDNVLEGAFTQEYYKETTDHDVIFVGDCEVYENFSPVELWNDYGITSYIRGNAQQLIWQSYYMLEDTLRYEKPKVVIYNVQSLTHNTPQKEEYNRMTIDGMRWSKYKYQNIKASMLPEENIFDYVFPLLRYHSRITQLTKSDITYYNKKKKVTHNGYYMRVDKLAYDKDTALEEDKPKVTKFGSNAMKYMDMMRDLCKKSGIKLVLVKAPSLSPKWFDEYEQQVQEYAKANNLDYINYLKLADIVGMDYNTDTYDGGLHMNLSGAKKLSKHIGKFLSEKCDVKDHRNEKKYAEVWKKKTAFYNNMIKAQNKELKKYGYLKSFGGEASKSSQNSNGKNEDDLETDMFGGFD
ncbi:MAG: SGNH/GDSL hydrolase family protein [Clostridium sp.]|uniref:SGNH/GDSL hydrolase family protein n=1 Tax=Butyribacter sp. TaxID=2822465 RepID=UPI002A99BA83|nr:SGNH/GDSL hydrolase family protein [Clostridium sp.]MDY5180478.1 SGNH/GDSL hydrolase family protein [Butyribacter sp.]